MPHQNRILGSCNPCVGARSATGTDVPSLSCSIGREGTGFALEDAAVPWSSFRCKNVHSAPEGHGACLQIADWPGFLSANANPCVRARSSTATNVPSLSCSVGRSFRCRDVHTAPPGHGLFMHI
jgi:hypothetical protein